MVIPNKINKTPLKALLWGLLKSEDVTVKINIPKLMTIISIK